MNITRKCSVARLVTLAMVLTATTAFASVPIRGSSENGVNSDAFQWLLLGRTAKTTLTNNGKSVDMTREVVCANQDVEASLPSPTADLSGSCDSGVYLVIFQFQSSSTNVNLKFKGLGNFTASESAANYGVLVCDNNDPQNGNTLELCTQDPAGTNLPDITFTVIATQAVNFLVPSFPTFNAGTVQQGRGLTLFLLLQQNAAVPIHLVIPEIE